MCKAIKQGRNQSANEHKAGHYFWLEPRQLVWGFLSRAKPSCQSFKDPTTSGMASSQGIQPQIKSVSEALHGNTETSQSFLSHRLIYSGNGQSRPARCLSKSTEGENKVKWGTRVSEWQRASHNREEGTKHSSQGLSMSYIVSSRGFTKALYPWNKNKHYQKITTS